MATPRYITPIKLALVERVRSSLTYLSEESCSGIGSLLAWDRLKEFPAPFVFVGSPGEVAGAPEDLGTNPVHQFNRFEFPLYCGAENFDAVGTGLEDDENAGRVGLESMLDDLWWALAGFKPTAVPVDLKFFLVSNTQPHVESHRVTAISTWYCDVDRQGQTFPI